MTRTLVVDDSRVMRTVVRSHLLGCGLLEADLIEGRDGLDALMKVAAEDPALVLSDVNMPRMDGLQLVQKLEAKGFFEQGRIVMVTSRYEPSLFRHLLHIGVSAILRKPFTRLGFQRAMEPVLQELEDLRGDRAAREERRRRRLEASSEEQHLAETTLDDDAMAPARVVLDPGVDPMSSAAIATVTAHVLRRLGLGARAPSALHTGDHAPLYFADIDTTAGAALSLVLHADMDTCDAIGTRLTGAPPIDDDTRLDVLAELSNIVVGDWLALVDGGNEAATFGLPKTGMVDPGEVLWDGLAGTSLETGGHLAVGMLGR